MVNEAENWFQTLDKKKTLLKCDSDLSNSLIILVFEH